VEVAAIKRAVEGEARRVALEWFNGVR